MFYKIRISNYVFVIMAYWIESSFYHRWWRGRASRHSSDERRCTHVWRGSSHAFSGSLISWRSTKPKTWRRIVMLSLLIATLMLRFVLLLMLLMMVVLLMFLMIGRKWHISHFGLRFELREGWLRCVGDCRRLESIGKNTFSFNCEKVKHICGLSET